MKRPGAQWKGRTETGYSGQGLDRRCRLSRWISLVKYARRMQVLILRRESRDCYSISNGFDMWERGKRKCDLYSSWLDDLYRSALSTLRFLHSGSGTRHPRGSCDFEYPRPVRPEEDMVIGTLMILPLAPLFPSMPPIEPSTFKPGDVRPNTTFSPIRENR